SGSCYNAADRLKLLQRLNKLSQNKVIVIDGRWLYYVHLSSASCLRRVESLVQAAEQPQDALSSKRTEHLSIYITPRNISPWSSLATNIAHVCGLKDEVHRIERGRHLVIEFEKPFSGGELPFRDEIYDRMTEILSYKEPCMTSIFTDGVRKPLLILPIFEETKTLAPLTIIQAFNQKMGLGLDQANMEHLVTEYEKIGRAPTDVELFMWAQVNSEHCRHHVFNAAWTIDGVSMEHSLFNMIKNTHKKTPDFTISAYSDNAAVLEGRKANYWAYDWSTGAWAFSSEVVHPLIKVETHNHPTAISPFPGAATGSGGEIRDEGAVGRGSSPKAGLVGFWVSDLLLPSEGKPRPWENDIGKPAHYASSFDIMLEAPIGSARFNNEFGRPVLTGVFRTLLTNTGRKGQSPEWRGYHKPIMIAGGIGAVREQHALKNAQDVHSGARIIVLGGPALLIGLNGGASSSSASTGVNAELDFNSVQRQNPEMERRCQSVIDICRAMGRESPIAFIHDVSLIKYQSAIEADSRAQVGAGGLSNAVPEIARDAGFGGKCELRAIESHNDSMSPLEIWCNEAQERYVVLVNESDLGRFTSICRRERCSYSDIGEVVSKDEHGVQRLVLTDSEATHFPEVPPIDLPMDVLFPPDRKTERKVERVKKILNPFDAALSLTETFGISSFGDMICRATKLIFHLSSVGSKMFLITIADRSVGGLSVRDQLVGPWQTPVADAAVTLTSFKSDEKTRGGEAMAMGEKPTLALISPAASARMAVVESLMNLAAADILGEGDLKRVKLSANWMAAVNYPGEGANLYDAVEAIGMELCPELGLAIPVGKDSTSMSVSWKDKETNEAKSVTAPVSVVISAFSLVKDVRSTWTPQLRRIEDVGDSVLLFVDLARGHRVMGGSALAQCLSQTGDEAPDVRDTQLIKHYFRALQRLHQQDIVLAYHDRSDGGLITTVTEMMFAGRCGVDISTDDIVESESQLLEALFNEELGAVFQVRKEDESGFIGCFTACGIPRDSIKMIGHVGPTTQQSLVIRHKGELLIDMDRGQMQQWWSSTSLEMQKVRDDPECAESEFNALKDAKDPGLSYKLTFNPADHTSLLTVSEGLPRSLAKPHVAILREQGVNGHAEMAFAFLAAGFEPIDVHMSDILSSGLSLSSFRGLAIAGGFSYGDVLGAGQGWAKSILMHEGARKIFKQFFERTDTFTLGVCNGCQMLTRIKELIPGADNWPTFAENKSTQFEARFGMVRIQDSDDDSVFFRGMDGSELPIVVSHGEGRAVFEEPSDLHRLDDENGIPLRYIDNYGQVTESYPANPNGSVDGIAGVKSKRVLALMPHPERTVMADVGSWAPKEMVDKWGAFGPWARIFVNARRWVG
ncbi:MAG: hypothetical protein Q9172_007287, partial [Xanthocarpia lactea]